MMSSDTIAIRGLTSAQVEISRRKNGPNQFIEEKRSSFWSEFILSFGDPIIKILIAALAINVLLFFRNFDWYEAVGIAIAIFLATFVSTLSEYGSESAFRELQKEAATIKSRVRRGHSLMSVPVAEIVVGDIVLLQSGERIPADGILISGELKVDQSSLNGESRDAKKIATDSRTTAIDNLNSSENLFSGTVVCSGEGIMRVERVGSSTIYGSLAKELQGETRESPLKLRLAKLADDLSKLGYIAAALVAIADLTNSFLLDNAMNWSLIFAQLKSPSIIIERLLHALTLAITTVVVAVPEGLPMMITVVLSSNMRRMLKDHVLVRKLVGIETSGSLNILFTDKTGTLTQGKMSVSQFVTGDGKTYTDKNTLKKQKLLWELIELSCGKNTDSLVSGKTALGGNATDRALLEFVLPLSKETEKVSVRNHLPFDSKRKYSAVTINSNDYHLIKGAPEIILSKCKNYFNYNGSVASLKSRSIMQKSINDMTDNAMRVLAIAVSDKPITKDADFSNLTLIGLIGMRDEIRRDAREAVKRVKGAGVQVVMITGDNRDTAIAIARDCGLLDSENTQSVLTSDELSRLSDDDIKKRLSSIRVVARALPTDKSRLVRIAQEMELVVGMTGDGVNDAPALKKADVGFAMGSGTEVAKEAGDIVILNNSFSAIAKAILYGRTIFKSIRKFIIFQLTMNLCAVGVSVIGPLIGIDTPVTVVQMLWVNIIMDTLAGLAFAGEPPLKEYMNEEPKRRADPIINRYMLTQICFTGLYTIALCVAFLKLPIFHRIFMYGTDSLYYMTAFFALFIFSGIFNSFSARTHRLNIVQDLKGNPLFLLIMAVICVVQVVLIYYGGPAFRTEGIPVNELIAVILIALSVVPADFIRKLILKKHGYNRGV